jgi:hypothetical protein
LKNWRWHQGELARTFLSVAEFSMPRLRSRQIASRVLDETYREAAWSHALGLALRQPPKADPMARCAARRHNPLSCSGLINRLRPVFKDRRKGLAIRVVRRQTPFPAYAPAARVLRESRFITPTDIRFLKTSRQPLARPLIPIRRIGFVFKGEPPRNFLNFCDVIQNFSWPFGVMVSLSIIRPALGESAMRMLRRKPWYFEEAESQPHPSKKLARGFFAIRVANLKPLVFMALCLLMSRAALRKKWKGLSAEKKKLKQRRL